MSKIKLRSFALFTLIITSLLPNLALAEYVHILCPSIDNIHFLPGTDPGKPYIPLGYAKILNGNFPSFAMQSWTSGNTVKYFAGASYIEDAFICNYWDGAKNAFVLVDNGDLAPNFQDCNFKEGDRYECNGDTVEKCELVCKR